MAGVDLSVNKESSSPCSNFSMLKPRWAHRYSINRHFVRKLPPILASFAIFRAEFEMGY